MRNKQARAVWVGIVVFYVITVSTAIVLDISLNWGLIVGLKILAVIHILLVLGVVVSLVTKREQE
jgi:hypothetical protein